VICFSELCREESVWALRENERGGAEVVVEQIHVVLLAVTVGGYVWVSAPLAQGVEECRELGAAGFEEHEEGGEWPWLGLIGVRGRDVCPVRARHSDGSGGKEEEVVEVSEKGNVGVEVQDSLPGCQVEGAQLGNAGVPVGLGV
jgi:hypothetical protein